MLPPKPSRPEPQYNSGTQIETDEDIRRALLEGAGGRGPQVIPPPGQLQTGVSPVPRVPPPQVHVVAASPAPKVVVPPVSRAASPVSQAVRPEVPGEAVPLALPACVPYRPTLRPPVAELTVIDDGKTEGEVIRIRSGRFVIGRTEGDLLIPHDELISTRHIEITRQQVATGYRWTLTDLGSTNGVFVRVSRTVLAGGSEFIVGSGRYRFDSLEVEPVETGDHRPSTGSAFATRGWAEKSPLSKPPTITEIVAGGIGNRVVLTRQEYWIGSDPACDFCRSEDPFCEWRHVRVSRNPKGTWQAEHNKTLNGLWFRVLQTPAESTLQFQIGEQRFRLRV
jgi:hypothetical protein